MIKKTFDVLPLEMAAKEDFNLFIMLQRKQAAIKLL